MKRALLLLFMLLVGVGLYCWLPIEPKWSYVQDDCRATFNDRSCGVKDGIIRIVRSDGSQKFLDAVDGHDVGRELSEEPLEELSQSQDGRYLVGGIRKTGAIPLLDRQTGILRKLEVPTRKVNRTSEFFWSPKGSCLIYREASDQWLVRLPDGNINGKWMAPRTRIIETPIRHSFDAKERFYAGVLWEADNGVKARLWDLNQSREHFHFPNSSTQVTYTSISPDGRWLFTSHHHDRHNASSVLHDLHSNISSFRVSENRAFSASFSTDGRRLECTFEKRNLFGLERQIWDTASRTLLATYVIGTLVQDDVLDDSLSRRYKRGAGPSPSIVCLDAISEKEIWNVPVPFAPIWLQWYPGDRNFLMVFGEPGFVVIDTDRGTLLDLPQLNRTGWASDCWFPPEFTLDTRRIVVQQIQVQTNSWVTWLLGKSQYANVCLRVYDLLEPQEVVPGGITTWPTLATVKLLPKWISDRSPHLAVCVPIGDSSFWIAGYDLEARPWARILFITLFAGAIACLMGRLVTKARRHH